MWAWRLRGIYGSPSTPRGVELNAIKLHLYTNINPLDSLPPSPLSRPYMYSVVVYSGTLYTTTPPSPLSRPYMYSVVVYSGTLYTTTPPLSHNTTLHSPHIQSPGCCPCLFSCTTSWSPFPSPQPLQVSRRAKLWKLPEGILLYMRVKNKKRLTI